MTEQCILVQFSVSWGVGPDSGHQNVWVGLIDVEEKRVIKTKHGDSIDILSEFLATHPGLFIYTVGSMPLSISTAFGEWLDNSKKAQRDMTKGW